MKKLCALVFALLLACFPVRAADEPLRVVASFSILGDMVHNIGGKEIDLTTLVGPNVDAHTYQPTPEDVKKLATADIVFMNGLGFEGWMQRLLEASGTHAKVIVLSDSLKPRVMYSLKGVPDPHVWQNITNARIYSRAIAAAFEATMPQYAKQFMRREVAYDNLLKSVDDYTRRELSNIPVAQRKIVTSHDAFSYFGGAYGVEFLAPIGINTEAEPSAAEVARLIAQIKKEGVKKVFLENMTNSKLIKQIADDTGAEVGGTLYADALSGTYGPAPTYVALFRNNVTLLHDAMVRNKP